MWTFHSITTPVVQISELIYIYDLCNELEVNVYDSFGNKISAGDISPYSWKNPDAYISFTKKYWPVVNLHVMHDFSTVKNLYFVS